MSNLATWFNPSLQVMQRAKGRSAVAAAAYRSCTFLHDERVDIQHDYRKKGGHVSTELFGVEGLKVTIPRQSRGHSGCEPLKAAVRGR